MAIDLKEIIDELEGEDDEILDEPDEPELDFVKIAQKLRYLHVQWWSINKDYTLDVNGNPDDAISLKKLEEFIEWADNKDVTIHWKIVLAYCNIIFKDLKTL